MNIQEIAQRVLSLQQEPGDCVALARYVLHVETSYEQAMLDMLELAADLIYNTKETPSVESGNSK